MSLARTGSGLLYQSDGSLTGWTSGGDWSSASDPAYCCFDPLPISLLATADGGSERDTVREFQMMVDSAGVWHYFYDGGDGYNGWRTSHATSVDRGLTAQRWGAMSDGVSYTRISGGSWSSVDLGWIEERSGTWIKHRLTCPTNLPLPNAGVPAGPYGWDIWTASSPYGSWTGVREIPFDGTGSGPGNGELVPGSIVLSGGTYYCFASVLPTGGNPNIGLYSCSTATGIYTPVQTTPIFADWNLDNYGHENPDVFMSPTLGVWCMLLNSFVNPGGFNDRNTVFTSSSLTDWSGATGRFIQRVSPMDSAGAIGVIRRITGPDGALVYDAATGMVPVTFDGDADRWSGHGMHLGRRIKSAVLEPSANCLRYAGSGDTMARSLTRSLSATDVVIECAAEPTAVNGGGGWLAVDITNGSGNGYRFEYAVAGQASLYKLTAGSPSLLTAGSGSQPFDVTSSLHRLKVSIQSGALTAWLNGEQQATATDSTTTSFTTLALTGQGIAVDVRCLSARTSDTVTIQGLTPGNSCTVRGYGGLPAGAVAADASGDGSYAQSHYPLYSLDIGDTDYTPSGGIWGGDTLVFSGLPPSAPGGARGLP